MFYKNRKKHCNNILPSQQLRRKYIYRKVNKNNKIIDSLNDPDLICLSIVIVLENLSILHYLGMLYVDSLAAKRPKIKGWFIFVRFICLTDLNHLPPFVRLFSFLSKDNFCPIVYL